MRFITFVSASFLLIGCSASGLDDYRESAEHVVNQICDELQECENQESLQDHSSKLKKLFQKLVDVVIDAREYQIKHPDAETHDADHASSDRLLFQLNRIYQFEKGRQIVEASQKEALEKLDSYEVRLSKRQI